MRSPLCFVDSKQYNTADFPQVVSEFALYPSICQITDKSFSFRIVGILCTSESPVVVFPKNFDLSENADEMLEQAKTLTRVLIRYRSEPVHEVDELSLLYGDAGMSSGRIVSAMLLLEDYCRNGYLQRTRILSSPFINGRVDWPATIDKTYPVLSKKELIYPHPISRKSTPDTSSLIPLIHKSIIEECFREWSWFFGYDDFSPESHPFPTSVNNAIHLLENELRSIYVDRELNVIKLMLQYLREKTGNEAAQRIDVLATPYFSFVWESICGYLMDNQYSRLKVLLPQPVWESGIVNGAISQRPDIFRVSNGSLYILDAKYYDVYHNLPGWHDVVKQLFYRHTLCAVKDTRIWNKYLPDTSTIYNAFLFPGKSDDLQYIGLVHVPEVSDLGEILGFTINQYKALHVYAYHDDSLFLQTLRRSVSSAFLNQDREK